MPAKMNHYAWASTAAVIQLHGQGPLAITYVNPAVAALLGVAVLHESFTVGMGIGFVLVLIGSTLATRRRQAPAPQVSPAAQAGR